MIKDVKVSAGNFIRFRVYREKYEIPTGVVIYHQSRPDLECTCKAYRPGKTCSHIEWLAKEFTYDKTFEDIRQLISEKAGVNYSYTVIEDLWDKCLKVTNQELYESFKQGARVERNPLKFKLERIAFGVDTSSKPDETKVTSVTVSGLQNLKDSSAFARNMLQEYQRYFLEELEKDLTKSLISEKTATTVEVDEWKYMGPTAWGTAVFNEPYIKEERQEPAQPEEPKPPPKPKSRFSEMEL